MTAAPLPIDAALLDEARALEIDPVRISETALRAAVARARANRWRADNAAAIESANAWTAERGLPLDRYRPF